MGGLQLVLSKTNGIGDMNTIFSVATNEWFNLENNWLKFKTLGKLLIILEEFREYISNY